MKAPLKQKKEEEIKNKKKQTKASEKIYNNVTSYSRQEDGKVKVERAEDRLEISEEISEVMELSKRFLPVQNESHRMLVVKHMRNHGKDVIVKALNLYIGLLEKGRIEKPVNSPVYFWNEGIEGYLNRVLQGEIKAQPKFLKRYCESCGEFEFDKSKMPQACECGGILYSPVEWQSVSQRLNPKSDDVEVVEETSNEQKEFMDALHNWGESMRMK